MTAKLVLRILGEVYNKVLRDLLVKAVKDTDTEVDDAILVLCDSLFGLFGPVWGERK